jgi:hypothetical protein
MLLYPVSFFYPSYNNSFYSTVLCRLPLKLVSQGSLSGEKVVFEQVTHLVEVAKEGKYDYISRSKVNVIW